MTKIRIESKCAIYDGMSITFKAPCDCTDVDGINVYDSGVAHTFTFKDAHGNDLAGLGNLFSEGAYVKVVLDTGNGFAYLQNADTNGYLEAQLEGKQDALAMPNFEGDLDELTTTGYYWCDLNTVTNGPLSGDYHGLLEVISNGSGVYVQRFNHCETYYDATGKVDIWHRMYFDGQWYDWTNLNHYSSKTVKFTINGSNAYVYLYKKGHSVMARFEFTGSVEAANTYYKFSDIIPKEYVPVGGSYKTGMVLVSSNTLSGTADIHIFSDSNGFGHIAIRSSTKDAREYVVSMSWNAAY